LKELYKWIANKSKRGIYHHLSSKRRRFSRSFSKEDLQETNPKESHLEFQKNFQLFSHSLPKRSANSPRRMLLRKRRRRRRRRRRRKFRGNPKKLMK